VLVARRHSLVGAVLFVVIVTGCGTVPVTPLPSAPTATPASATPPSAAPTASDAWLGVDLAQPSIVTVAPSLEPGYRCSPCHAPATGQLLGVGTSTGGLIAVGVQQPPAQAVAFTSTDGTHWIPLPGFTGATGTSATAEASNGIRTVIVGLDHSGATAWASDGGAWTQAPRQADLLVPYAAGAMTSVTAFDDGFIAGGYRDDPLHAAASAAVWRSNDGLTWHADADSGVFGGGRIWGIAARAGTVVAVGTSGDPNYGPAAVWRWTEATGWQRGRIGPDAGGAMLAVAVTASAFVAVGQNGHDDGALAWTSPDGFVWTAAPDQPAFHYAQMPVRMQSVVAGSSGLVAGGWRSDAGNGSAVAWTSADGVTWQGPVWETSFSGGQVTGLAVSGGAVVAVGRSGYPDNNQAAIWVSAAP
jgi:hypothetical protein